MFQWSWLSSGWVMKLQNRQLYIHYSIYSYYHLWCASGSAHWSHEGGENHTKTGKLQPFSCRGHSHRGQTRELLRHSHTHTRRQQLRLRNVSCKPKVKTYWMDACSASDRPGWEKQPDTTEPMRVGRSTARDVSYLQPDARLWPAC